MIFETLGDPHLGRKFEAGVPVHRRGERERMQLEKFRQSLFNATAEVHVCMGDLYDKFIVPPEVVLFAAATYLEAANKNPNTTYVVLRGNHDVSRNVDKASSWDIFCALVDQRPNIIAVDEAPVVHENLVFIPYDPFGYDHLEEYLAGYVGIDTAFGHFDIVDFGGSNVAPTALLARYGIKTLINGHDHLARELERHTVRVVVTGSMEPFTHAEDPTGSLYITTTLEELPSLDVKDKNVRVLLQPGETLPEGLDCLSLVAKRVTVEEERHTVDTSDFDAIDLKDMLARALDGLSIKTKLMEQFQS